MNYRVLHTSVYRYAEPVSLCHNLAHLGARPTPTQESRRRQLLVQPLPEVTTPHLDYFGNHATSFSIQQPHRELKVIAVNVVRLVPPEAPAPALTPPWEQVQGALPVDRERETLRAYEYTFDSRYVKRHPDLVDFAAPSFAAGRPLLEAARDLTRRIFQGFHYDKQATTVSTPVLEVLRNGRGVCQDFAHLQIACLRSLGLAARYVSGYLLTTPPPGQPRLVGADASHAWLSLYCPPFGWVDLDPTNDLMAPDKHITLAWGRDYDDVSPIKGVVLGGGRQVSEVAVDVVPVDLEGR